MVQRGFTVLKPEFAATSLATKLSADVLAASSKHESRPVATSRDNQ